MLRVKRIVAFIMAMIICISFCLSVNAEAWDAPINEGVTSAHAYLSITE